MTFTREAPPTDKTITADRGADGSTCACIPGHRVRSDHMTNPRHEALIDHILANPGPVDDDPRDHEAMAEARRDPEADLDRAEDMYEKGLGL